MVGTPIVVDVDAGARQEARVGGFSAHRRRRRRPTFLVVPDRSPAPPPADCQSAARLFELGRDVRGTGGEIQ